MKRILYQGFIILLFCFVISTFIHEVGHGISSSAAGIPVSTGFNRVGQVYKKPHDVDFRKGLENNQNPWDMGPNFTLAMAIVFTFVLSKTSSKNKAALMIVGALACCNSIIRLVPMVHAYTGLLIKGSPYMEDEIGTGLIWYKLSNLELLKYLPALISSLVSVICLYFVIKSFKRKMPELFSKRFFFTSILVSAYILSVFIENVLDNIIRINWV